MSTLFFRPTFVRFHPLTEVLTSLLRHHLWNCRDLPIGRDLVFLHRCSDEEETCVGFGANHGSFWRDLFYKWFFPFLTCFLSVVLKIWVTLFGGWLPIRAHLYFLKHAHFYP